MATLVFDIECYKNFFLAVFKDIDTGEIRRFQQSPNTALDIDRLTYLLHESRIVGFNSRNYDLPIIQLALQGFTTEQLHYASFEIINLQMQTREFRDKYCLPYPPYDHIDLIEVAPLKGSLKVYAGRLHAPRMQDLPIDPNLEVTAEQAQTLYRYCLNDLDNTALLFSELAEQIKLREQMSQEYGQDLRSRSDAQVAEYVIASEVAKLNGTFPKRPEGLEGTRYSYRIPDYIHYSSPELRAMLEKVRKTQFTVRQDGGIGLPVSLEGLQIRINHGLYRLGIGGLHSCEKSVQHIADEDTLLIDRDVASYYPAIILNQGLYPKHLGPAFLEVYRSLVQRRLDAKKAGNKVVADSLKITINGSFGKFGSMWSSLYSPDLLIQVTITGQLSLLMLIEMIENAGIEVVSANTDGILIKCRKAQHTRLEGIIREWEQVTGFETEETRYRAYHAANVNNYLAIKEKGGVKGKGAYALPEGIFRFHKNPQTTVCVEAVVNLLAKNIPIKDTIYKDKDIRKFVTVRKVEGGAVKDGEYIGKVIRFYYSRETKSPMRYIKSGNKVPKSEGAKPLMELPVEFPKDINFPWYVAESQEILREIGYSQLTLF